MRKPIKKAFIIENDFNFFLHYIVPRQLILNILYFPFVCDFSFDNGS